MARAWQDRYPAATAIGRRDGVRVLQIYALTARCAGVQVENPRQVNAWLYPRQYGPTRADVRARHDHGRRVNSDFRYRGRSRFRIAA